MDIYKELVLVVMDIDETTDKISKLHREIGVLNTYASAMEVKRDILIGKIRDENKVILEEA